MFHNIDADMKDEKNQVQVENRNDLNNWLATAEVVRRRRRCRHR